VIVRIDPEHLWVFPEADTELHARA
jgi:hypothetical protein